MNWRICKIGDRFTVTKARPRHWSEEDWLRNLDGTRKWFATYGDARLALIAAALIGEEA